MAKVIVALVIACLNLIAFTAGAHADDLCADPQTCEQAQDSVSAGKVHATESSSDLPHEDRCPVHHSHGCHHAFQVKRLSVIDAPSIEAGDYLSAPLIVQPSPLLEGPFQPPKA